MRNYIIFGIAIVVFIVLMGQALNKCQYLAEGFSQGHDGIGGGRGVHSDRGGRGYESRGHVSQGSGATGDHMRRDHGYGGRNSGGNYWAHSPPTFGAVNNWGYYPVYTQYEYPVYYTNPSYYYEMSDENGMFYYFYNPWLFFKRLFGY
jgi:hypothetical protein